MEPYFSDHHAAADSQLGDKKYELTQSADSYDGWMHMGKERSHELRYREAILAYTKAINLSPGRIEAYRQRGGKYLATLQRRWRILNDAELWAEKRAISAIGWALAGSFPEYTPRRFVSSPTAGMCAMMNWASAQSIGA